MTVEPKEGRVFLFLYNDNTYIYIYIEDYDEEIYDENNEGSYYYSILIYYIIMHGKEEPIMNDVCW